MSIQQQQQLGRKISNKNFSVPRLWGWACGLHKCFVDLNRPRENRLELQLDKKFCSNRAGNEKKKKCKTAVRSPSLSRSLLR